MNSELTINAVINNLVNYKAPYKLEKGHPNDSGYDVRSTEQVFLRGGETKLINTGVFLELPLGWECQVRSKSSISSQGILVHLGTVDEGYRGEVKVTVTNLNRLEDSTFKIDKLRKIAQLVFVKRFSTCMNQVEDIDAETTRGANGFGSTGEF